MPVTQDDLDNWFTYHSPREGQQARYQAIREAAKALAETILRTSAASADQTAAIRKIREAVMTANQGIACENAATSWAHANSLVLSLRT